MPKYYDLTAFLKNPNYVSNNVNNPCNNINNIVTTPYYVNTINKNTNNNISSFPNRPINTYQNNRNHNNIPHTFNVNLLNRHNNNITIMNENLPNTNFDYNSRFINSRGLPKLHSNPANYENIYTPNLNFNRFQNTNYSNFHDINNINYNDYNDVNNYHSNYNSNIYKESKYNADNNNNFNNNYNNSNVDSSNIASILGIDDSDFLLNDEDEIFDINGYIKNDVTKEQYDEYMRKRDVDFPSPIINNNTSNNLNHNQYDNFKQNQNNKHENESNNNNDDDGDDDESLTPEYSYITETDEYYFADFKVDKIEKPLRMLITGPSGCGKTHFLMNFLYKRKKRYDYVYAFVGSRLSYVHFIEFIHPSYVFFTEQDLPRIPTIKLGSNIIEHNDKYHPIVNWINLITYKIMHYNFVLSKLDKRYGTCPKDSFLFLFDDLASNIPDFNFKHPVFNRLFKQGRHDNIEIAFISQKISDCITDMRTSITHFVPFRPTTKDELIQMAKVSSIPEKEFDDILIDFKANKYVLIVDKENPSPDGWLKSTYKFKPCKPEEFKKFILCHPYQTMIGEIFKKKDEETEYEFDETNINLSLYHKGKKTKSHNDDDNNKKKKCKKKSGPPPEKKVVSKPSKVIFD